MMKKKLFCLTLMLVLIFSAAALSEGQDAASFLVGPEQYRTVGAHVTFGTYPQTETGEDRTPIEWMVMEVDEENHKAFLLSFRGLDSKRYHREYTNVTWETCSLQTVLWMDHLRRQGYAGQNLPAELCGSFQVFSNPVWRQEQCRCPYRADSLCLQAGARQDNRKNKAEDGSIAGWWFLRSPGCFQNCAAAVGTDGSLYHTYVNTTHACVRPAFWLDLDSDFFSEMQ